MTTTTAPNPNAATGQLPPWWFTASAGPTMMPGTLNDDYIFKATVMEAIRGLAEGQTRIVDEVKHLATQRATEDADDSAEQEMKKQATPIDVDDVSAGNDSEGEGDEGAKVWRRRRHRHAAKGHAAKGVGLW